MHKPSNARMSMIGALATMIGMAAPQSTADVFRRQRGPAPAGMKYVTGVYIPGGSKPNVEPAVIRNPKVAAQVGAMHDKWLREQFPSRVTKAEPDPDSITSIKKRTGGTRNEIRAGIVALVARDEGRKALGGMITSEE